MNTLNTVNALDELICRCVQFTNKNIFLTGKAGTGKTTLLKTLTQQTHKRFAIIAPTGVAAINAGGSTIHSFLQLHPHTFLPYGNFPENGSVKTENPHSLSRNLRLRHDKINVLKSLDLLVIDEVSMVRCDLLDAVDTVLRRFRGNSEPFGGVQLLLIGDLYQLPPVVKDAEAIMLKSCYPSFYFFESQALKRAGYIAIELKHVYRQADPVFVDLLNEIRYGKLCSESAELLNKRHLSGQEFSDYAGYITLTTHVFKAEQINTVKLDSLPGKEMHFKALIDGEFNEQSYPADGLLRLKKRAQVMFVKNNRDLNYFNGKIGWIELYDSESQRILVRCEKDEKIWVSRETWKNVSYTFNKEKNSVQEDQKGEFSQYPLRLAWAITIHKSQGLTFDKAVIDAGSSFAPGQVYVALSRCRTLEGIVLKSRFSVNEIRGDLAIDAFHSTMSDHSDFSSQQAPSQLAYLNIALTDSINFGWLRNAVRSAMEAVIPYLKALDAGTAEKVRGWEASMQHIANTSFQYMPQVEKLLSLLSLGEVRIDQIEKFNRAVTYFIAQLAGNFIKPLLNLSNDLQKVKGTKSALTEISTVEISFREGIRKLIVAGELLQAWMNPEIISIKNSMQEKLAAAYTELSGPIENTHDIGQQHKTAKKTKEAPGHTFNVSLELYRKGKSINEIAFERELKPGTIVSHLCRLITRGQLDINEVLTEERVNLISSEMDKITDATRGKYIALLSGNFPDHEISLVNAARMKEKA